MLTPVPATWLFWKDWLLAEEFIYAEENASCFPLKYIVLAFYLHRDPCTWHRIVWFLLEWSRSCMFRNKRLWVVSLGLLIRPVHLHPDQGNVVLPAASYTFLTPQKRHRQNVTTNSLCNWDPELHGLSDQLLRYTAGVSRARSLPLPAGSPWTVCSQVSNLSLLQVCCQQETWAVIREQPPTHQRKWSDKC